MLLQPLVRVPRSAEESPAQQAQRRVQPPLPAQQLEVLTDQLAPRQLAEMEPPSQLELLRKQAGSPDRPLQPAPLQPLPLALVDVAAAGAVLRLVASKGWLGWVEAAVWGLGQGQGRGLLEGRLQRAGRAPMPQEPAEQGLPVALPPVAEAVPQVLSEAATLGCSLLAGWDELAVQAVAVAALLLAADPLERAQALVAGPQPLVLVQAS